MKDSKKIHIAWLAICLTPLSGLGIDIYTPALPIMAHYFVISGDLAKLSISVYLLGYGLSQLFWGPMSDYFGRKNIVLIGVYGMTLCTILITVISNFTVVLFLRLLHGIFVGAIGTSARAILVDLFTGKTFSKYVNYSTIAWAVSPIIAPLIGAYLTHLIDWRACFISLSIYGLIMIILTHIILIRTNPESQPLHIKTIAGNLKEVVSNKNFRACMLLMIFSYSTLAIFYVTGPFIIQVVMNHSPVFFGHLAAGIGAAWLAGNIIARIFNQASNYSKMLAATTSMFAFSVIALGLALFTTIPAFWLYVVYLALITVCSSLIFPLGYTACLSLFRHMAGIASALTGSIFWVGGSIATFIAVKINLHHTNNIFFTYATIATVVVLVFWLYLPSNSELRQRQSNS